MVASQEPNVQILATYTQVPTSHMHVHPGTLGTEVRTHGHYTRKLVPLFLALDHQNYARWLPIHIRDLDVVPDSIKAEFEQRYWTITRSNRRFSSIPIDHAHEQANKRVKGAFSRHESSPYPPASSFEGSLKSCAKSGLLVYIMAADTSSAISVDEDLFAPGFYDIIIIDGGVLIHPLPGTTVQGKTFYSYFDKVFCPRVHHDLKRSTRVDIVWNQYCALRLTGGARE